MKRTIVVGSAGQDGRLLTEHLTARGARIVGIQRNKTTYNGVEDMGHIDITDADDVARSVKAIQPEAIYYLAAFHHSAQDLPLDDSSLLEKSRAVHVRGLDHFLAALAQDLDAPGRLFYASSSLIFGNPATEFQNEKTPFLPDDVYGRTKAEGVVLCRRYRAEQGVFAASGILYNHESHYRGSHFVSKKIIQEAVAIKRGKKDKLVLGDLGARCDWGFAPDYVRAMRMILELDTPDDFIIATGETHSVLEFVQIVFEELDMNWEDHVTENPGLIRGKRPTLKGDSSRLRERTGWKPSLSFREMVRRLLLAELKG